MFLYSIIIISFLFAGNAADNCLNVKDITDKYDVNKYTNPYYNDEDKNVYYSFNISVPEAYEDSTLAIVYNRSNLSPYDSILVIVFADCPDPRFRCGLLDVGIYDGEIFRENFAYKYQYRQDPADNIEVQEHFIRGNETDGVFIARYQERRGDPNYRGKYNVFIIPAAKNESVLENHKGHYCRHKMKFDLYVPLGNYSVMQHTKYYNDELKKCDCTSEEYYGKQKDDKDKSASPVIPVVIGVVVAVVVIGVVVVVAVLYHRGMLGNIVNQHRTSGVPA